MKYCWKCGSELVDEAVICPKCGCAQTNQNTPKDNNTDTELDGVVDKKNDIEILVSILIPIIGIIMFFVQRKKTPTRAKANLKAALITWLILWVIITFFRFIAGTESEAETASSYNQTQIEQSSHSADYEKAENTNSSEVYNKATDNIATDNIATDNSTNNNASDTKSKSKNNVVGLNEEFGNNTITGIVTSVDMDYTEYNELWTEVPSGYHVIYATIKVTNISDKDNYVSVGDFDCYVDDVAINAELIAGGDHDYNNNIAPGRSAILGAEYVIPDGANSIELEYSPIGESTDRIIIKIK